MAGLVHASVGLVSKKAKISVSIWRIIFCVYFIDIIGISLDIIGIDTSENYIWSHSLVMSLFWSSVIGGLVYWRTKQIRLSIALGLLVFSHWIVDFITWPMSGVMSDSNTGIPIVIAEEPNIGLGLWRWPVVAYIGEFGSLLIGLMVYLRSKSKD